MVQDPDAINGLFLFACRSLSQLSNDLRYHEIALSYKGKTINSIIKSMAGSEGPASDSTIASVLFLALDEVNICTNIPKTPING